MATEFLMAGLGLAILLLSGDSLVRGAVNLSLRLGVPKLLVSLTIVAFGTSAPELLVSLKSVLEGVPGIAVGNVVGSNIANVLLVLGVPALVSSIRSTACDARKSYVTMMLASVMFAGLALTGPIGLWKGMGLLALLALILGDTYLAVRRARRPGCEPDLEALEGADLGIPVWQVILYLLVGLVGLPFGADLLVDSAVLIAHDFGVSEAVIGLTLVAIGTSLPELATTVMAAVRQHAEVALGNVIGSNMFNLLAIIGTTAVVHPVAVTAEIMRFDLWVMLGASVLLFPFVYLGLDISRRWGLAFIGLYASYLTFVVVG
ncbi:MAG: sodium:calcium antiporter [Alphaproteobacteria bacterium]|nr:MAG: sodium:calcium antiporter [Alphaproteobacteria bacterium]